MFNFSKVEHKLLSIPVVIFLCCLSGNSYAHDIPISRIQIVPDQNEVHLQLVINSFELSFLSEIDHNHNGYIDSEELDAKRSLIKKRLLSILTIAIDETNIQAISADIMLDEPHHLIFRAHYPKKHAFESLKLVSNIEHITSKSQLIQITFFGTSGREQKAQLRAGSNTATFTTVRNRKVEDFWTLVSRYQTLLCIAILGLAMASGMYISRKLYLIGVKN